MMSLFTCEVVYVRLCDSFRYKKTNTYWSYWRLLEIISPKFEILPSAFGAGQYFKLLGNNFQ